jgi:hypothetical protein
MQRPLSLTIAITDQNDCGPGLTEPRTAETIAIIAERYFSKSKAPLITAGGVASIVVIRGATGATTAEITGATGATTVEITGAKGATTVEITGATGARVVDPTETEPVVAVPTETDPIVSDPFVSVVVVTVDVPPSLPPRDSADRLVKVVSVFIKRASRFMALSICAGDSTRSASRSVVSSTAANARGSPAGGDAGVSSAFSRGRITFGP